MHSVGPTPEPRSIARDSDAYRFLMGDADEAVYFLGEHIEDCNEATCRLLGRTREALIGQTPMAFTPRYQADGTPSEAVGRSRIEAAFAGLPQWFRWHYLKGDGRMAEALVHLELVRVDGRRRLLIRARDLLELERAEHAVAETQTRFQQILDHTPVVAFVKDRAGRYAFANREFEQVVGARRESFLGKTDRDLFEPRVADALRRNDQRVLDERRPIEFEETIFLGHEDRTYLAIKFPILDQSGAASAVGGIATDITERKRADGALRQAAIAVSSAEGAKLFEELARSLADVLGIEVVLVAAHHPERPGTLRTLALFADGRFMPNVEYPMAGTPCAQVCDNEFLFIDSGVHERFPLDAMLPGMRVTGYAGYPLMDAAGHSLGVIAIMSRRPLKDRSRIESMTKIFAMRASAEIVRARGEEALRAREEQYHAVFNAAVDGLALWDESGRIVDANPAYCRLVGATREALAGSNGFDVVPEGSRERCGDMLAKILAGEPCRLEARAMRVDGSTFDAELQGVLMAYESRPHILLVVRDLTERRQAEAERDELAAQLRQAQKMEALGHLTGGIAHDFNNLLAAIMGNIALAAEREATLGDARLGHYLDQALLSSKKARDLIRQMLTYSRGARGERRAASITGLVRQASALLRSSLPATVELETDLVAEVLVARVDPVQVEQVLMNLCINARDAMGASGTLELRVARREAVRATCASCRQKFSGDYIEICVSDRGPGIAPEVAERMFEPFYTTKEPGKGSGMGLSTVHGVVHEHGGHVLVETAPGQGARFRVLLPHAAQAMPEATIAHSSPRGLPRARLSGCVLLVDDEDAVLSFMRGLLEGWGLSVTTASGGRQALALFESDPGRYDAVISDQTMPHVTGIELARQVSRLRPGTPLALCTGFGGSIPDGQMAQAGVRALLAKPVEPGELFVTLETWLGREKITKGLEK